MLNLGTVRPGSTIYIPFASFASATGASTSLTGLATTDIECYRDGSTTQRSSDNGYTLLDTDGIDFDGITGINGFSISLADNSDAGFYRAGSDYFVVIASVTVDGETVNFVAARFTIGYPNAILNTTIATLASQTSFTLTAGPAEDDALNGIEVVIHDVASAVQLGRAVILDYTGSTKTVTLAAGTTFTAAATDNISVMGPSPLMPTVAGRTLDIQSTGEADVNLTLLGGDAQSAIDLKDFADDGYDPATNKVQGVVLVDTVTTLTNLPAITANWLTAAGTAADFGTEVGTAVWATAARTLTAATNITSTGDPIPFTGDGQVSSQLADGVVHGGATAELALNLLSATTNSISWNAAWDAEVQSEAQDALVANRLDELLAADSDIDGAQPPTVGSVFHELMSKTAGSFTFNQTTDSLEALRDWIPSDATIADEVWNDALINYATAGTFGKVLGDLGSDWANGGRLDLLVDAILADTGTDGVVLANGAITDAKITIPAEASGRPTTALGMLRRIFEWVGNKRIRTRATGVVQLRNAADDGNLETATQSTAGGVGAEVDTQSAGS